MTDKTKNEVGKNLVKCLRKDSIKAFFKGWCTTAVKKSEEECKKRRDNLYSEDSKLKIFGRNIVSNGIKQCQ